MSEIVTEILDSSIQDVKEDLKRGFEQLARDQIVSYVRRWGGPTSDAVLDPAIEYFMCPKIEGVVGFRRSFKCAVVLGDPICALEARNALTLAFHEFAKAEDLSVIYIAASHSFTQWAMEHVCSSCIGLGEIVNYDPAEDPRQRSGTQGSLVRRKVKRAIREGVSIHELKRGDVELEKQVEEVGVKWLQSRKGPQIHISNVHLFEDCEGKRWFYAFFGGKMIGSISLNRLEALQGWLINHLMVLPEAPVGTSELLFTSILETLNQEGCRYATVGFILAKQLREIRGFGKFSSFLAKFMIEIARKVYDLDGLHTFWGKFHPKKEPSYLLFSRKKIGFKELLGVSRATNGPI